MLQYIITMIVSHAAQAGINDEAATEAALSILLAIGEYYQNQVLLVLMHIHVVM